MIPTLYLKLGALAVVLALVGWHHAGDLALKRELAQAQEETLQYKSLYNDLKVQYLDATKKAEDLEKAKKVAENARVQVQADLVKTQQRLKVAQIPKDCDGALNWLIEERK